MQTVYRARHGVIVPRPYVSEGNKAERLSKALLLKASLMAYSSDGRVRDC